jgi:hypothetical protein
MIMVLRPPRNVYPQISKRQITIVSQNGTPISSKIKCCKTIATRYHLEDRFAIKKVALSLDFLEVK